MALLVVLTICGVSTAQGFVDITATTGMSVPTNPLGLLGRGACCGDFDGDGDQDLIVPGGGGGFANYYFQNNGGNAFTDLTATAGLGLSIDPKAVIAGDVDNDGDLDLFIANLFGGDQLFINNGSGVFVEDAAARGLATSIGSWSASFGDYDRDGLLDLYVGARHAIIGGAQANRLYRNTGGGVFVDVTATAGVGNQGYALVAPFLDYNQDGWPDIFVANDKGSTSLPTALYKNNRDGTFTDVSTSVNAQLTIDAMGVDFTDAFNRNAVDIYLTDLPPDHHFLVWDSVSECYQDQSVLRGLAGGALGWGCHFLDYDNDGWQDLYVIHNGVANHLYKNPGTGLLGGTWPEVAVAQGIAVNTVSYHFSSLVADFDDDGRMDMYHILPVNGNTLTRNQVPGGNWLKVVTRGTVSNRDGIGARITVTVGTQSQTQYVRSGIGYLTGSDMRCNFGLGTALQVDQVRIVWPSGQEQHFTGVPANQILIAHEPALTLQAVPWVGSVLPMHLSVPGDAGLPYLVVLSTGTTPGYPVAPGRAVPLALDWLLFMSLDLEMPTPNNGVLSPTAEATMSLPIPSALGLVGWTIYSTAVTVDYSLPHLIRTIMQATPITLL